MPRRSRRWISWLPTRISIVLALMCALETLTFHGYLSGSTAPPWDFYSAYNTEAMAWWRDGSFFHPTQWMPYAWGGYPSLLNVQNSSFYLPVGLLTALAGPLTIKLSAILFALHVGFGALGAYLLLRSWRVGFTPALIGLVAWFYAAGFYSNAEHVDIARAWAWLPWFLRVADPGWKWHRWWSWPVAGLILWQGILSMYPGIVVAVVYVGGVYVMANQVTYRPRPRTYLIPLLFTAACAAAMSLLRFLPAYLVRGAQSPSAADTSAFSFRMLGDFLYPYGSNTLPNDVSMRSFFIAASILVLLPFVAWSNRRARPVVAMVVTAVMLGLPFWAWHGIVRGLPGMDLSRFTMSDFKPALLLGLVLLGTLAAHDLGRVRQGENRRAPGRIRMWIGLGCAVILDVVFLLLGLSWPKDTWPGDSSSWLPQYAFLTVALVVVCAFATGHVRRSTALLVLLALTALSGYMAQRFTHVPWNDYRIAAEKAEYGSTVASLLAQGESPRPPQRQRPARLAPKPPLIPEMARAQRWGAVFYSRQAAVMGYVNLKGTGTYETINRDLFTGPRSVATLAFWSAPGMLIPADPRGRLPAPRETRECALTGRCGPRLQVRPTAYGGAKLRYQVDSGNAMDVMANEAYYRGWTVTACQRSREATCRTLPVHAGRHAQVVFHIPRGMWSISLSYVLPGLRTAWNLWWVALVLLMCARPGVFLAESLSRRVRQGQPSRSRLRKFRVSAERKRAQEPRIAGYKGAGRRASGTWRPSCG